MFKKTYIFSILLIPLHSQDNLENSAMVLSRLFYCYLFYLNWTCVSFVVLLATLWKNIFVKYCLNKLNFVVALVLILNAPDMFKTGSVCYTNLFNTD